jgi:hypothetical protein
MMLNDTIINIPIKTLNGSVQLDIIDEFKRRAIGGFAGSFPFARTWQIELSEEKTIAIIKTVKQEYKSLCVPGETNLTSGKSSYWHFVEFYDASKNEIIKTWVRDNKTTPTSCTVALVGYRSNNEWNEKLINKDFWKVENDSRIAEFETLIINKILGKIK